MEREISFLSCIDININKRSQSVLNWGNINDSTTVVEGSVLLVQWLIQQSVDLGTNKRINLSGNMWSVQGKSIRGISRCLSTDSGTVDIELESVIV